MLSRVWYAKRAKALKKKAQRGGSSVKSGDVHAKMTREAMGKSSPSSVMRLGATHVGTKRCTMLSASGERRYLGVGVVWEWLSIGPRRRSTD